MDTTRPELAFYYPGWIWEVGDWAKNLLLFFDGIALLVPEYMRDRPLNVDPAIAGGLHERGLLTILEPESFIDQRATEALTSTLIDVLTSGALDDLATRQPAAFHSLSYSRMGGVADPGLAQMIYEELEQRGLARPSEDGLSVPLHPVVRSLILVLLSQALRRRGNELHLDLVPATDKHRVHRALIEILDLPSLPSAGHVVSLDLQTVGVDLGPIPLDEVLAFRNQYGRMYRAYMRALQRFLHEVAAMPSDEQVEALRRRREEIEDTAADLQEISQRAWAQPVSFALGLAGAAWTAKTGDPLGALLGGLGIAAGQRAAGLGNEIGAYSYLFKARRQFPPTST